MHILVVKRIQTDSKRYKDKWKHEDKLRLITTSIEGIKVFRVISLKAMLGEFVISRDEIAFIKLIHRNYGGGDYCIRTWAKGKERTTDNLGKTILIGKSGIRTFWDGIITDNKTFYRRRSTGYMKENPSVMEKTSYADSEQKISDFMKVKRPGVWYSI